MDMLNSTFALRDLGQLSYFLGVEVTYDDNSLHLCQTKYIVDLLERNDMLECKPAKTLLARTYLSMMESCLRMRQST